MYSRTHPYLARIRERSLLTTPQSTRKTYHIVLELSADPLPFQVGDSIAVLPMNDPHLVDQILSLLRVKGTEEILDPRTQAPLPFRDFLLYKANIHKVSFHKLYPVEKTSLPLVQLLQHHQPHPSELARILLPLLPRFYSIASSPKVFPQEIHLTVAYASSLVNGEIQLGVGSHFLCDLARLESTPIPIYVQPSHHFTLPSNGATPLILIGPGTGIAPFRAFLQERIALQATGPHWLFFGERNRASDFYYADYWLALQQQGRLRLDLAFSRDQEEKIYVQHKMWQQKSDLWRWLQEGAQLYVCGDANKMAKDVDLTLHEIARSEGNFSEEEARKYLKALKNEKRYLLDVY